MNERRYRGGAAKRTAKAPIPEAPPRETPAADATAKAPPCETPAIVGRVVYSTAGRDRKRPFVIVGVTDDGSVLIADGKLRTAAKPKRKNLLHLRIEDAVFDGDVTDGAAIREYLRSYEERAR